jgi:hypothetical protein
LGKVSPWVKNNRRPLGGAPLKLEEIMKKLMTALAACLVAGFAVAQGVTSANVVGYLKLAASGTYPSHGPTFITVGDTGLQWTLGNMTAEGAELDSDFIQFLNPADTSVSGTATYCDSATATGLGHPEWQGWWDIGDVGGTSKNGDTYGAGTGFLCNFGSGSPIEIMYAGEVVQDQISLDLTGLVYPMVANPVPTDLTLGAVTAEGMELDSDFIQFLDPADTSVSSTATYCDLATATGLGHPEWQGWWEIGDVGGTSKNTTAFPAGTAVLCNLGSGNSVTMVFPNPVP